MLQPGTTIGRYVVKRKLAEGGMAEIYLAAAVGAEGFSKEVVLKVVKEFLTVDRHFLDMFLAEAKLGSKLSHANIVQIFDFGKHEETFYLAMEYVRGASLWDLKKRTREWGEPFPPVLAAEIGSQVARGMQHAHTLKERGATVGIVHRDVTPHNVLLGFDGAVKLTDFGIAKASTVHTSPGVLKGKFAYMAPEQSLGDPVDARTDVFALGIVLWELVTGGRLFDADTDVGVLRAVLEATIVPPVRLNPLVGEELSGVIMRALARPLAERYQSAFELERALATYVLRTAKSPEETSVSSFLQRLFAREYDLEGRPGTPIGRPAVKRVEPGDDFGSGKTLHVDRGHDRTAPNDSSRRRTDEHPELGGPLEDGPSDPTHQMPEQPREHTAEMLGIRSSRRLPSLNTSVGEHPGEARVRTDQMPGLRGPNPLPMAEDAPRTERALPDPAAVAAPPEMPSVTEGHPELKSSRAALYGLGALGLAAGVLATGYLAMPRLPEPAVNELRPLAVATAATDAGSAVEDTRSGSVGAAPLEARASPSGQPELRPRPEGRAAEERGADAPPADGHPVEARAADAGAAVGRPAAGPATDAPPAEATAPGPAPADDKRPAAAPPTPTQARGTLALKAVPFANVQVHGQSYEVEGTRVITLPPGQYSVTFTHPRATKTEKVIIRANQTSRLSFDALNQP